MSASKSVALTEVRPAGGMVERTLKKFPEVQTRRQPHRSAGNCHRPDGPGHGGHLRDSEATRSVAARCDDAELCSGDQRGLEELPGVVSSLSQPIKFRMMELLEGVGVRSDVGIKIFGDDMDVLQREAEEVAAVVRAVPGAEDVKVQQIAGCRCWR